MVIHKLGCALSSLFIVFWFFSPAKMVAQIEQTNLGSVEGVVLDQQSKPIADTDVHALLQEDMRRTVATTITDSAGKFILHDIPAGAGRSCCSLRG